MILTVCLCWWRVEDVYIDPAVTDRRYIGETSELTYERRELTEGEELRREAG